MKKTGSSIPTDKGKPRPRRLSKVRPQAVFRKIILAELRYFPEKPCTAGTRHLVEVGGMESPASTYIKDIDIKDYRDYWLHLSDYSDMGEFLSACSDLFPGEKEPEYRYPKWENIPDTLISREWLCPNFFEIRDALERLEEEETEFFISWSRSYGYDITTDDPHMMVSHYHDLYGDTVTETEEDADTGEDALIYTGVSSYYCDMLPFRYEIFDDNYD